MQFLDCLAGFVFLLAPKIVSAQGQTDPPNRCAINPALIQRLNPVDTTIVCGQAGDFTKAQPLITLTNIFTPAVCALECAGLRLQGYRHTCISFVHNPTSGNCRLFGALPVFQGFQGGLTSGSPRYVYHTNCFQTNQTADARCDTTQIYNPVPGYPLMCGFRATVKTSDPSELQSVIPNTANILACAEECATAKLKNGAYTCLSFSFNQQTRTCKTYYVAPFLLDLTKDSSSKELFYNTQCFSSTNVTDTTT